jgi:predicted deacylase
MLDSATSHLTVGGLTANPGERTQGHLVVGEMQDGTPVRLPIVLLRGHGAGRVLYIQAASDGDELNGVGVVHRFLRDVDVASLRGGVIVCPIVNYHAFHGRTAVSPVDNRKMNRCFPGRADGSSSERIAHSLFHEAVLKADLCVDLHQGGVRPMIDEVRVRTASDHPMHDACMELARVFGLGYILDAQGPPGQLAQAAPDHNILAIDPELGGCTGWDETSIEKGVRGLWNVLFHYGLVEGTPTLPQRQYVVDGFEPVRPSRGGFVEWRVALYDHVEAEQELGWIRNVFAEPVERLVAPVGGVVWGWSPYPMAASGETILTLGVNPRPI